MLTDFFDAKNLIVSFFIALIAHFTVEEKAFIVVIVLSVTVDTLLGSLLALKQGTFCSQKMRQPLYKIVIYGLGLGTVHAVCHFARMIPQSNESLDFVFTYIDSLVFSYVLLRELTSIAENSNQLGVPILPPWLSKKMAKMSNLDKSGKSTEQQSVGQSMDHGS